MLRSSLLPWITFALLALGMPGCDRGDEAPDPKTADAKASAEGKAVAGCDAAHGKALEQELLAQCTLSTQRLEVDVPTAPWKPAPSAAPDRALRLDLGPDGMQLGGWGERVPMSVLPVRFAEERERLVTMAAGNGPAQSDGWTLAIASETPRADVAAALQVLADAGLRQGHLRLATDPGGPLPLPRDAKLLADLAARLAKTDPSEQAMLLAKEPERLISCPAMKEVFSSTAVVDPDDRCGMLARDLSKALVGCSCANEAEVMTLFYAVTVGVEPRTRLGVSVAVSLDPAAASRPGATWAEVVAGLDEAALARLWIGPS